MGKAKHRKKLETTFDKSLDGLEKIEEIIIKAQQNPQDAFTFVMNKWPKGPEFIWGLGQKKLGVLFFCLEEKSNLMKVQVNSPTYGDELDYVRVEKSMRSNKCKWQITGQPPGAFKSRCLAIYESKEEAVEAKNLLVDEVRQLKPCYWDRFTMDREYLDLIANISEDKDMAEAVFCGAFLSKMLGQIEPEST